MIPDEFVTQIGVHLLEAWFLSLGFQPSGDWDAEDPACLHDYGPYRVISVQAHAPEDLFIDTAELFSQLQDYLADLSCHPGTIKFCAYEIDEYQSTYFGRYIFASIYHPA